MPNFVNLLDIVYPVGSAYISFSDVSPVESIGGSWEKIEGKFLQSSDSKIQLTLLAEFLTRLNLRSDMFHTIII